MTPALLLSGFALLLGQVLPRALGPTSSPPTAHSTLVAYSSRTSILGGRFVLVDTLRADVQVAVTAGSNPGEWRYSYMVVHRPTSTGRIDYVAIGPLASPPIEVLTPPHWAFESSDDPGKTTIFWLPIDLGPAPSGWVDDGTGERPSAYAVAPGDSLGGFGFVVRGALDPFATVSIDLRVWQRTPSVDDEWIPECPYRAVESILGPGARR
jgi:hypothetical protein